MKRAGIAACFAAGFLLLAGQSSSASPVIINGSFEFGPDPGTSINLPTGSTDVTGWTVTTGNIDYIGSAWQAATGFRSLDLNGLIPGSIAQTVSGLTPGQSYTVSFDLAGNYAIYAPEPKILEVSAGNDSQIYTFDDSLVQANSSHMHWQLETFTFTATGVSDLLTFASLTTAYSNYAPYPYAFGPALDNVSITGDAAATPIPAALPLFATGLGGLGLLGWRRKRKA